MGFSLLRYPCVGTPFFTPLSSPFAPKLAPTQWFSTLFPKSLGRRVKRLAWNKLGWREPSHKSCQNIWPNVGKERYAPIQPCYAPFQPPHTFSPFSGSSFNRRRRLPWVEGTGTADRCCYASTRASSNNARGTRGHTRWFSSTPSFASRWDRVRPLGKRKEASRRRTPNPAAFNPTLSTDRGTGARNPSKPRGTGSTIGRCRILSKGNTGRLRTPSRPAVPDTRHQTDWVQAPPADGLAYQASAKDRAWDAALSGVGGADPGNSG
ncbi:hypothetical protein NPIL_225401 [Nephila pilipes]|uniref:Uncharacterized protein n=1 Tax=Nephila pilipes TaxID=299642 RepID=A0A8X6TKV0_NEPPI|nr:hypothetical protein NPIL_225401 [Nephila pilipes]